MKTRSHALRIIYVLAMSCSFFSCDGTSDAPATESDASSYTGRDASQALDAGRPDMFGSSPCGQCAAEECHDKLTACSSAPACAPYLVCMLGCGLDEQGALLKSCDRACQAGAGAVEDLVARQLADCIAGRAYAECKACGQWNLPDVLTQQCTPSTESNPCWRCEDEKCCETFRACEEVEACGELKACIVTCDESPPPELEAPANATDQEQFAWCVSYCADKHPEGIATWAPRITCLENLCADACSDEPIDPCARCMLDECVVPTAELTSTPQGFLLSNCIARCPTGVNRCNKDCIDMYDDYKDELERTTACGERRCPMCIEADPR